MNQFNIFNVSDLVQFYHDQELYGEIKVFFRKSYIKVHYSKLDNPFFIVKPLVVKVRDIFDNELHYIEKYFNTHNIEHYNDDEL